LHIFLKTDYFQILLDKGNLRLQITNQMYTYWMYLINKVIKSPDQIPIELLWQELKRAVNAWKLKKFCMQEWDRISPQRREADQQL
jgi:hypothetical protein